MERDAILSECGRHRYLLTRRWTEGPTATFIMLNPSTADALVDDPTIRRCIGFARREGCGGLAVANLYSLRATDPDDLVRVANDRNGPKAAHYLSAAIRGADGPVIYAWGSHPLAHGYGIFLRETFGGRPMCLGMTKGGAPRHPLYLRADAPLVPFAPSRPRSDA